MQIKNYIKIIFAFCIIMLLTGCTGNYNLYVQSNGTFKETISGSVLNKELENGDSTDVNTYLFGFEMATPLMNGNQTFEKKITEKRDYKDFVFTYEYRGNYNDSRALNVCFNNAEFIETDDYYYFSATGEFNCQYSNKMQVSISSDYASLENNADKVKGNTYIWNLKKGKDADIFLVLSKNVKSKEDKKIPFANTFEILGFIILIILTAILYLFYRKKYQDNLN